MRKFILVAGALAILLIGFKGISGSSQDKNDPYLIGPVAFKKNVIKPGFVLIDVRTPEEFNASHIKGALNIDYNSESFKTEIEKLDKSNTYLLYCRSGTRSGYSKMLMNEIGIKDVYSLRGGILGWKDAGYPVEDGHQ